MLNSQKFKTTIERAKAFDGYCNSMCRNERGECNPAACALEWLDLEAEEEKTLPCPFCGSNTVVKSHDTVRHVNNFWIECTNCNYRSEEKYERNNAIAAHNRVSRAVMEAGKKEAEQ